ncbi:MAG: porin [Gemmatimonadaceae bacterium]|nr:porin [Acetobacteraceae bacterium]
MHKILATQSRRADRPSFHTLLAALLAATALGSPAYAQLASPPEQTGMPGNPAVAADAPYVAPRSFSEWSSGIKLNFQGQAGITGNVDSPRNSRNFGRLTDDLSNRPVLNQLLGTVSRDVDPKATSPDFGFKLQLMYGSDARIYHTLGVFDQLIHDRNQLTVIEANATVRLPGVFANGLDIKAGIYPTPLGVELIDPKNNAFYSHSYIFNYGLPFKHTGVLATAHVSDMVDVYFGVDSGTNVAIGYGNGDNNNRPGGIAGIGLNFGGGKVTVLALTHIGPENSRRNTPFGNSSIRYFNDIAVVWKATDKLTLTTEGNFVRDDGARAEAWGIAQYASYAVSDTVTLNGRAELFRDNSNFFVGTPQAERDFSNLQRGVFSRFIFAPKATTYGALTAGLTYKPTWMPQQLTTAMIRPEVRYDRSLNNVRAFNDGRDRGSVTLAADIVIGF